MADELKTPPSDKNTAISAVASLIEAEVAKKDMTIDKLVEFHKKAMAKKDEEKAEEIKKLKDAIKQALMNDDE